MRALLLVVVALVWFGSACSSSVCGPANCSGCCDGSGRCQTGIEPLTCGAGGLACTSCALGLTCSQAQCVPQGIGGGTGTGGGTATGGGGGSATGGGGATYTNDASGLCFAYYGEAGRVLQQCGLSDPTAQNTPPSWCSEGFNLALTPDQASSCIAGLKGLTCLSLSFSDLGGIPGCEQIVVETPPGPVGVNGPCRSSGVESETCQADLFCEEKLSCPRRCLPRLAAGQAVPINEPERCQRGLYALNGVCTVPTPVGQSCAAVNGQRRCVSGAFCKQDVCAPLPAQRSTVGQPCSTSDDFCELGAFCDGATCKRYSALGAACSASSTTTQCAPWLVCGINNECVRPGKFGAVCRSSRDCDSDFTCDIPSGATVGTCNPRTLPVGSACASATASRCESSTWCTARSSTMTGVCATRKAAGVACTFDEPRNQCATGLDCTAISSTNPNGVCAPPSPAGGPCRRVSSSFGTQSYGCSYETQLYCRPTGTGEDGVCTAPKSAGAACTWPADANECAGFCNATSSAPNGVCVASGGAGAPCSDLWRQCLPDFYCASSGTCAARKLGGAACATSEECYWTCSATGTCEGCP